ncbi:hypothetical protein [Anaerovibrio sp.]|uniref:hypothetical protein n=1 Tax=Anaerovibrio sp. TaxID=1872532 RepID=UPI00388EF177
MAKGQEIEELYISLGLNINDLKLGFDTAGKTVNQAITKLNNQNKKIQLKTDQQQKQLQESEKKLSQAEQESEKLQNQIYSLRKEMIEQENSLEIARASLEQFEKEEQAKLNKAKQEKTVAWIIAGLLLCFCISK